MQITITAEIRCRTPTCTGRDEKSDELRMPTRVPRAVRAEPETPVCTRMALCRGCQFPRNGFICWFSNGQCMRTLMRKKKEGAGEPLPKNHNQRNMGGGTHTE